ncbi:hypothetical protein PUN28_016728 [Cardiocondyla obscurior]|uniref:Uncharacterized protein n=1 Tax=Cardiocondyla obscurior TaxID=286306 RepID=A0AAW2ER60_9HYME
MLAILSRQLCFPVFDNPFMREMQQQANKLRRNIVRNFRPKVRGKNSYAKFRIPRVQLRLPRQVKLARNATESEKKKKKKRSMRIKVGVEIGNEIFCSDRNSALRGECAELMHFCKLLSRCESEPRGGSITPFMFNRRKF